VRLAGFKVPYASQPFHPHLYMRSISSATYAGACAAVHRNWERNLLLTQTTRFRTTIGDPGVVNLKLLQPGKHKVLAIHGTAVHSVIIRTRIQLVTCWEVGGGWPWYCAISRPLRPVGRAQVGPPGRERRDSSSEERARQTLRLDCKSAGQVGTDLLLEPYLRHHRVGNWEQ